MARASVPIRLQPRGLRGITGAPPAYETDSPGSPVFRFVDPYSSVPLGPWINPLGPPGPSGDAVTFATIAAAEASVVTPGQPYVHLTGYYAVDDGGGATYKASPGNVEPAHGLKFETSNGRWYEAVQIGRVNVRVAGAKGDGSTEDLVYFNRAKAYATLKGIGVIYVPDADPGDGYLVSDFQILVSGQRVEGNGRNSLLINNSTNKPILSYGTVDGDLFFCGFSGLAFAQKSGVTPVLGNCGALARRQVFFFARDYVMTQFPAKLYDGFASLGLAGVMANDITLENGFTSDLLNNGHHLEQTQGELRNIRSHSNGANGFFAKDCPAIWGWDLHAFGNADHAFMGTSDDPDLYGNIQWRLFNPVGDTSGKSNYWFDSLVDFEFHALWSGTNILPDDGGDEDADGVELVGTDVKRGKFIGGAAVFSNRHGVNLVFDGNGMPDGIEFENFDFGHGVHGNGRAGAGYGMKVADPTGVHSVISVDGGRAEANEDGPFEYGTMTNVRLKIGRAKLPIGFNPLSAVPTLAPLSSPFSWTNGPTPAEVFMSGGTVSHLRIDGVSLAFAANVSPLNFRLQPGETMQVTYSVAPNLIVRAA